LAQVPPHSQYHWNHGSGRFFEGWYYRVTLPEINQSFAFMYAIDDPQGNTSFSGGSVQVLGIDDQQIWRTLPNTQDFRADRDRLWLEHWGLDSGYAASDRHNQGKINDPVTGKSCSWDYEIESIETWGDRARPSATMGWLSYLPVFEPGWQILLARGWASGSINWCGENYKFDRAPTYIEKNWGRSFPQQWFWLQCNAFLEHEDLSITCAGGIREVLGNLTNVAMVGIHHDGEFYNFMPENSEIHCDISAWGEWRIQAINDLAQVQVIGTTADRGTKIMVPTATGLKFCCLDTAKGTIRLSLRTRSGKKLVIASSNNAALEVGGKFWDQDWRFRSAKL